MRPSIPVAQRVSLLDRSLLVLLGATVAMAVIASIAAYVIMTRTMLDERLARMQRETDHRADLVEVYLDRRLDALEVAAEAFSHGNELPDPEVLQRWLNNQTTLLSQFNQGVLFFDEDAVAVAESQFQPGRLGTRYADREHFQVVMASRMPYRAAPVMGRATGLPLLSFLVPLLRDDGTLMGLMGGVMEVDGDTIDAAHARFVSDPRQSPRRQSEASSRVWVIDPINRVYVSHPDEGRILEPLPPPGEDALVDAVWTHSLEPVMRLDDGKRWAVASKRLDTLGWVMVEAEPHEDIVQPVLNTLMRYFALMLVALLSMLLFANAVLRRAIEPLTRATGMIDQMILNPEQSQRLPPSHIREVDRLSWAFNQLSDQRYRLAQSKDAFIATVSHELKTPLTAISGSLRLLESGAAGELPARAQTMVSLAVKNSQSLLGMVNDLLDISRVLAGQMHFDLEPLYLPPLVDEALASNRDLADQHRIELDSQVTALSVQADAQRLRQILDNLINNAIKFSPDGSRVDIGAYRSDSQVCLWVLDSGPGIPEDFEDRIFQRFAQADDSDHRAQQGTGLGLAICRDLAEGMGGHIDFEPGRARGAHFRVWLPLAREDSEQ